MVALESRTNQAGDVPRMPPEGKHDPHDAFEVAGTKEQIVRVFKDVADARGHRIDRGAVVGLWPQFGRMMFLRIELIVKPPQ